MIFSAAHLVGDSYKCPADQLKMISLQQNMKKGPVVARLMKIMLHFYLVFTIAFTFSFVVKVRHTFDNEFENICVHVVVGLNCLYNNGSKKAFKVFGLFFLSGQTRDFQPSM